MNYAIALAGAAIGAGLALGFYFITSVASGAR